MQLILNSWFRRFGGWCGNSQTSRILQSWYKCSWTCYFEVIFQFIIWLMLQLLWVMLHEPCLCHYKSPKTWNFSAMAFESATKRNRVNVQVGDISKFMTCWSFDLLLTWAFISSRKYIINSVAKGFLTLHGDSDFSMKDQKGPDQLFSTYWPLGDAKPKWHRLKHIKLHGCTNFHRKI